MEKVGCIDCNVRGVQSEEMAIVVFLHEDVLAVVAEMVDAIILAVLNRSGYGDLKFKHLMCRPAAKVRSVRMCRTASHYANREHGAKTGELTADGPTSWQGQAASA